MYDIKQIWRGMKARCYSSNNPAYADCEVCDEWMKDYKAFETWFLDNLYNCNEIHLELDKDLFSNGRKIYSPETCCLLPKTINTILAYRKSKKSGLPTGIVKLNNGKYMAMAHKNIGYTRAVFDTLDEAVDYYVLTKKRHIFEYAESYKKYLPEKIYNALINYEVER